MVQTRSMYRTEREIVNSVETVEEQAERMLRICAGVSLIGTVYAWYENTPHMFIGAFLLNICMMILYNTWLHSSGF